MTPPPPLSILRRLFFLAFFIFGSLHDPQLLFWCIPSFVLYLADWSLRWYRITEVKLVPHFPDDGGHGGNNNGDGDGGGDGEGGHGRGNVAPLPHVVSRFTVKGMFIKYFSLYSVYVQCKSFAKLTLYAWCTTASP